MKRCTKCGVEKPLEDFGSRPERPSGVRPSCKICVRRASANYRRRNPEKTKEYQRAHREEAAERTARYRGRHYEKVRQRENEFRRTEAFRAKEREQYALNRDRIRERKRKARLRNLDAVREREASQRERNRERLREVSRRHCAKRRSTPRGRLENRVRAGVHKRLRGGAKCGRKTFELLGYGAAELMAHLERQFTKGMSWDNFGEWHIDHIVPVSAFNFETPDDADFKACWALTNLRPLWATDNFSKGAKRLLLT